MRDGLATRIGSAVAVPDCDAHFLVQKFFKKNSVLSQNIESKGVDFFLPPRSMVLKVVRGKILETCGLTRFPLRRRFLLRPYAAQGTHWSDSAGMGPAVQRQRVAPVVRLSESYD